MLTKRHILSALLAATLSFGAVSAHAKDSHRPFKGQKHHSLSYKSSAMGLKLAQRSISPAEAKSIARKRVPGGEVVDIKRRGDTYSVRVIKKSGKVVDVFIDANTGRVKK